MRPIDADALKEMMDKILMPGKDVVMETYIDEVVCAVIDDSPTINYTPVRHGAIIESNENGRSKRVFSCCGTNFTQLTMWMIPNYCPNCGAKMDSQK